MRVGKVSAVMRVGKASAVMREPQRSVLKILEAYKHPTLLIFK